MPAPAGATPSDSIETLYVDIAARADRLVADAEAAVNQVVRQMQGIDRAAVNTEKVYSRLGGIVKQALTIATGISFYNMTTQVITRVVNLGKQLISTNAQMQMFQKSFEVLTGSAKEAGEIITWVKDQAKKTPFDVPGLINASQMLMTWGLDLKEWFTVVGDVAAGMNRPITQVVNAIGTLATGQTGEAVRRFRDLGINLREFTDKLTFDARGAMITPLEEAIPIVKQIMIDKFGGMMESQSKTWEGVMSNMKDTWQQFVQVVGAPIFTLLNERLVQLASWVEDNGDELESFATSLGTSLGTVLGTLLDIVGAFGQLITKLEEITHTVENAAGAIATARKVAGIAAVVPGGVGIGLGAVADVGGELASWISGEGFDMGAIDEGVAARKMALRGIMIDIAGVVEKEEEIIQVEAEVTESMKAGAAAVRLLGDRYENLTDEQIVALVAMGNVTMGAGDLSDELDDVIGPMSALTEKIKEQTGGVVEMAAAYNAAVAEQKAMAEAAAEAAAELERQAEAARAALELALEVAPGVTDTLDKAMKAMASGLESAGAASVLAIDEIMAKATEAQETAIANNQKAVAKMRADFDRDQLRRRKQFNQQWERLLREQNDTNADAETDYQYQRQQLLIEGDEMGLAELEARYKMEKDSRLRDQGQAQSDTAQDFENQQAELEAAFDERVKALEDRLQEELQKVRDQAEAAKKDQLEKDEETREKQKENAGALYVRLGEMLYDETKGNVDAAQTILTAWGEMYSGIELDAIWTAFTVRAQMMSTIALIIQAQQELKALRQLPGYIPTSSDGDPLYHTGHIGGYTPGVEMPVMTKPGEFLSTPSTTQALEQALGGRITQEALQGLALSTTQRRMLDVTVKGSGVPAAMLGRMYRDLITAMKEEAGEY